MANGAAIKNKSKVAYVNNTMYLMYQTCKGYSMLEYNAVVNYFYNLPTTKIREPSHFPDTLLYLNYIFTGSTNFRQFHIKNLVYVREYNDLPLLHWEESKKKK